MAGILESPTITPHGRVVSGPGYDAETKLLLITDINISVPDKPAKEDAENALKVILDMIAEYVFETETDKAVAVAAIMSATIFRLMPGMPHFAIDAPKPRSGKSLLCDCISIVTTGKTVSSFDWPEKDSEAVKTIDSILYNGDGVVMIDNIETTIKNSKLCSVATQSEIGARILGQTKTIEMPCNAFFLFNGNNLRFSGDIVTRILKCRINPMVEKPEERTFEKADLRKWTLKNRGKIITAILTIIKAHIQAGDKPRYSRYDSAFDVWDKMVRQSLIWLDLADVKESKNNILSEDGGFDLKPQNFRRPPSNPCYSCI